jgi:hypothetical protein
MVRDGSSGGPQCSEDGFGRKIIATVEPDTEQMKNTLILVCAKRAFVA